MNGKTKKTIVSTLLLGALLVSGGCLGFLGKDIQFQSFMIEAPRPGAPVEKPLAARLRVDNVTVLPPFNVRNFVIRKNDVEFATTYRAELLIGLDSNIRNIVFRWFSASGLFGEVNFRNQPGPKYSIALGVTDFHADVTEKKAVVELHVALLREQKGSGSKEIVLTKTYRGKEPFQSMDATDLVRAYDRLLVRLLQQIEGDVASTLKAQQQ